MTVNSSMFARPVAPGAGGARTIGWWANLLGVAALAFFVGALVVAYLYLRAGHAQWPPAGVALPDPGLPALSTALTAGAALSASLGVRWTARHGPRGMFGAVGAILLGVGGMTALLTTLAWAGFMWNDHAYGSVFWLMHGTTLVLLGAAVISSGTILAQHALGAHDTETHDEIEVLSLYWWFVVAASIALSVTATAVPYL